MAFISVVFFKQKTAYEMRISDWSSDVCSSDLARAAMDAGVARQNINDWDRYKAELRKRLGLDDSMMRAVSNKAKSDPKRVVFAEADTYKMLKIGRASCRESVCQYV